MGTKTSIEWAANLDGSPGATWNPVRGCSRISEGCRNCYAERMAARFSRDADWSPELGVSDPFRKADPFYGFASMTPSGPRWTGKVELVPDALEIPLRRKKPTVYFVNSMSDLFHETLPDEAIDQVFAVMALCPQHRFICLTKRAARMCEWFLRLQRSADGWLAHLCENEPQKKHSFTPSDVLNVRWLHATFSQGAAFPYGPWPLPNVILGVSCEDQAAADERIPHLLATPAACRMVSLEPLLGPIDLHRVRGNFARHALSAVNYPSGKPWIDWAIVGGESGPGARPMHPDWARSLRDQCTAASVPFFFKQWGEWLPGTQYEQVHYDADPEDDSRFRCMDWDGEQYFDSPGQWMDEIDDAAVFRLGKKLAGRLLDGRVWDERPEML